MNKLISKKGFTLAEVLITVGILAILISISIVGILHYSSVLKLTEMDATAREIFVAAQNHLTSAEASGELKAFEKEAEQSAFGERLTTKPSDFPESETLKWPTDGQNKTHGYYYIAYDPANSGNLDNSILKHMLPFGAIDEAVRKDGYYIIEYDIKTASVYSVFFTDGRSLSYKDVEVLDAAGGRGDSDESRRVRRNYKKDGSRLIVGYFGGAMAQGLINQNLKKPEIKIINEDKLIVEVIDLNNNIDSNIKFIITGDESKKVKEFDLTDDIINDNKIWMKKQTIIKDNKQVNKYTLCLDDMTTKGGHFTDLFPEFIPGEDISIAAECSSTEVLSKTVKAQETTNSLFEAVRVYENNDKIHVANIGFARHLQNLNPEVSNLPTSLGPLSRDVSVKRVVARGVLTNDIDWKNFVKYNWNDKTESQRIIYGYNFGNTAKPLATGSFYSICNTALTYLNGSRKTLSNFIIYSGDNDNCGLFGRIGDSEKEQTLEISDLLLYNFSVKSSRNAGGLIGLIDDSSNVKIYSCGIFTNKDLYNNCGITSTGTGTAGGLIGYSRGKIVIDKSFASVSVRGGNHTGGMIGVIYEGNIDNSYVGGYTEEGKYPEDYNIDGNYAAGGFIGTIYGYYNYVTINNCYSTASVKGHITGGFIGNDSYGSSYKDCYAANKVNSDGISTYTGGFLGYNYYGYSSFTRCYYVQDFNDGIYAAGTGPTGILGRNFDDLRVSYIEANETHSYGQDTKYPLRTVNITGKQSTSYLITGVHYGDWAEPKVDNIEGTGVFAYREKIGGRSYWYVVSIGVDKNIVVTSVYDELSTSKGNYVGDYSYGFLTPVGANLQKYFSGGGPNISNTEHSVTIGKSKYDFHILSKNIPQDNNGISTIYNWKVNGKGKYKINLYYNPDFAAAIALSETEAYSLGKSNNPYQVRSEEQLLNVGKYTGTEHYGNYYYNNSHFRQTLDIKFTDNTMSELNRYHPLFMYRSFSGNYSAKADSTKSFKNYEILNFNPNINGFQNAGLFGTLDSKGKIEYLQLSGTMTWIYSANTSEGWRTDMWNVGTIVGSSKGTIENCTSNMKVDAQLKSGLVNVSTVNIGGLVGEAKTGSKLIKNRYINDNGISCIRIDGMSFYNSNVNMGGLVGRAEDSTIRESFSRSRINERVNSYSVNVGGFIGSINRTNIENCYSATYLDNQYAAVGVFICSSEDRDYGQSASRIDTCHAIEVNNNYGITGSRYIFINNIGTTKISRCATYLKFDFYQMPGVTEIWIPSAYSNIRTFTRLGWDTDIWEVVNGIYPTLKNNTES